MSSLLVIDDLRRRISCLVQWRAGSRRAPHKPLLLLGEIARLQRGGGRATSYVEVEAWLQPLIESYAPSGTAKGAHYPFWRLRNDGLWELYGAEAVRTTSSGDAFVSDLQRLNVTGGISEKFWGLLRDDAELARGVAGDLLAGTFPESLHDEILDAVEMPWLPVTKTRREPAFREEILRAYEYRCAVCGYNGRLGRSELGLEAAHVRWCAYGGPNSIDNGLALCTFHHRVFDRGGIGVDAEGRIIVAQSVNGNSTAYDWIIRYSGVRLATPQVGLPEPARQHIAWHRAQVFQAPARAFA